MQIYKDRESYFPTPEGPGLLYSLAGPATEGGTQDPNHAHDDVDDKPIEQPDEARLRGGEARESLPVRGVTTPLFFSENSGRHILGLKQVNKDRESYFPTPAGAGSSTPHGSSPQKVARKRI